MRQDEFLALIGIQVVDTVQRHTISYRLKRLYLKAFFAQSRIESVPGHEGLELTYYTTPAAFAQSYQIHGNTSVRAQTILAHLRPQAEERFFDVKQDAIISEVDLGLLNIASILGTAQWDSHDPR